MQKLTKLFARMMVLTLLAESLLPAAAGAQSYGGYGADILCGLYAGSQFSFTITPNCHTAGTSTSGSAAAKPAMANNYVALGDSVAAGLGLDGSAGDPSGCGRSSQGYPNIVASKINLPLTNLTCSGATAGDLVTKQAVSGPNITAQLDGAFAAGVPKLITITAGANDAHWADLIKACTATDCSSKAYTAVANAYIAGLSLKLNYAFATIKNRSGSIPPRVIVTGYYNPLSYACTKKLPSITSNEITWIQNETSKLNSAISQAAANYSSFVKFTSVNFNGHDVCSSSPWVQGLNDAAPLHPNIAGQEAIARGVYSAYGRS